MLICSQGIRERIQDWDIIEDIYLLLNPATSLPRNLLYGVTAPVYFDKAVGAPDQTWLLVHLSVDPKYLKKGLGCYLLKWCFSALRKRGCLSYCILLQRVKSCT
jgi:hypothetical protein